ncbi:MAG: GNAT family N-acetyltransferase [Pseudomonadota bacterium]
MAELAIKPAALASAQAQQLIAALNAELTLRYPEEGANHFRLDPAEVAPGRGAFFIATLDGELAGCGAVRLASPGVAEVKRMYVRNALRGHGIAWRMLARLEAEARLLGAQRMVLETGERQFEAVALYRRAGYAEIERYGEYTDSPLSLCMGRSL